MPARTWSDRVGAAMVFLGKIKSGTKIKVAALKIAIEPVNKKRKLKPAMVAIDPPITPAKPMPRLTALLLKAHSKAVCPLSRCLDKIADQAGI